VIAHDPAFNQLVFGPQFPKICTLKIHYLRLISSKEHSSTIITLTQVSKAPVVFYSGHDAVMVEVRVVGRSVHGCGDRIAKQD
jgi:hypothetical protein